MHLVDTTMFFCARGGGVKRYLFAKHEWLKRHAPHIVHTLLVPAPQRAVAGLQTCDARALRLADGYRLPLDLPAWQRALENLQPDLVEAADPYIPAWAARQLGRRMGIPTVAFYHSDMPRMLSQRVGGWIAPISRAYLRSLYGGFDLVLAPSRVMHEELRKADISPVSVQPLGVDVGIFNPRRRGAELRDRLGLASDARLLVYAGRFAREKNIAALVGAVQALGDPYHLLMIGGRRAERASRYVTILPYQRNSERLAAMLASCDAFLHAGDQETYGLVAAEAMACGLPVVAVGCGAMPEIVDSEVGGCARRASASDLAAAVTHVFERDVTALGRAARLRVEQRHSWDCVFRQLLGHYARLAPRARMPESLPVRAEG
ncbi:MAG TPA: glycosyltransferase [Steroidobacteraceae bacterium]|jgi:alpha-1,6-mannosyltransferase